LGIAKRIIQAELVGVISWMLRGLNRLLQQGGYTIPASHYEESQMWRVKSDSVALFLSEKCVLASAPAPSGAHDWVKAGPLYTEYRAWADTSGHRYPVAQNVFGTRLKQLGLPPHKTEKANYYGVRLRRISDGGLLEDLLESLRTRPRLRTSEND